MRWDYTPRFRGRASNAEIKELQDVIQTMAQQLRMVLTSIDEDNLAPDIAEKIEQIGKGD